MKRMIGFSGSEGKSTETEGISAMRSIPASSIDFNFSKEVPSQFAAECNGSKRGARDLRNMIRKGIEDKIINTMI